MSIHKRPNGTWKVSYRIAGKQRSRTFDRKSDATTFDADIKRRRSLGPLLAAELDRETTTLDQFVRTGFRTHAVTLSASARAKYAWALERHLTELTDEPLLAIDVARVVAHQRHLLETGRTASTTREALIYLSGIMQVAAEHGLIPGNPVRAVRKPTPVRDEVRPLTPVQLETLIAALDGRDRIIVLLAGHLGLRPKELRSVPWRAFNDGTLLVGRAQTKATARRPRTIEVPRITAQELREWRLVSGRPDDDQPIIGQFGVEAIKSWTRQRFAPRVKAAIGRDDVTLYTLRHTHASLCHYAGLTVPEAARRLGHGPSLHITTYAHVIDGMQGQRYDGFDDLISVARANLVLPQSCPSSGEAR
jgi:integrase